MNTSIQGGQTLFGPELRMSPRQSHYQVSSIEIVAGKYRTYHGEAVDVQPPMIYEPKELNVDYHLGREGFAW